MEFEILLRKGLDLSVRLFGVLVSILRSIPPFVLSVLCLGFGLYKNFPTIFYLLVSYSPVIVCTALFLGVILSFGDLNFIPEIEVEKQEKEPNENAKNTHQIGESDDLAIEDDREWIFVSADANEKLTIDETSLTNHRNSEVDGKVSLHEGDSVSSTCEAGAVLRTCEGLSSTSEGEVESSVEGSTEHMKVHYGSNSSDSEDTSSSAPSYECSSNILLEECTPLLDGHPFRHAHFSLSDSDYTSEQSIDDTSIDSDELEKEWGIVERRDGKVLVDWGIDDVEESLIRQGYPNQIGESSDSSEDDVERYSYLELFSGISRQEESKVKAFNCKLPELDFSAETALKLPSLKARPLEDANSAFNLLHEKETQKHIGLESFNPDLVFLENERWVSNEDHLILELPAHNARASVELLAGGVHGEPIMVESVMDKAEMPSLEFCQEFQ